MYISGFILICKPHIDKASKHQINNWPLWPIEDDWSLAWDYGQVYGYGSKCTNAARHILQLQQPYSNRVSLTYRSMYVLRSHSEAQSGGTGFLQIKGDFTHQVLDFMHCIWPVFHTNHLCNLHKIFQYWGAHLNSTSRHIFLILKCGIVTS
jgi:hypothetical protein